MNIVEQLLITFLILLIVPVVTWIVYRLLRDKKYVDEVEAEFVKFVRKGGISNEGDYNVPVYRYTYNNTTYETESRYVSYETDIQSIDEPVIRLKVNPDDPYDVLECNRFMKVKRTPWSSLDTIILVGCIVVFIVTVVSIYYLG